MYAVTQVEGIKGCGRVILSHWDKISLSVSGENIYKQLKNP